MSQVPSSAEQSVTDASGDSKDVTDTAAGPATATDEAAHALSGDEVRAAAARRLLPVRGGLPGMDRLAGLPARLLGAGSGRVVLLSEVQSLVGAAGPQPQGAEGGEAPTAEWLCKQTAASGVPLIITDASGDERVSQLVSVTSGVVASYLGAPLIVESGHVVGAVCVFDKAPRSWSEQDVNLLQQVAAAAAAELELAALSGEYRTSQALLEVSVQSAGIGTFHLDVASGRLVWDEQMYALFDVGRQDLSGDLAETMTLIHAEDRAQVEADLRASLSSGLFASAYRVCLPGGGTRWLEARGRVLRDATGAPVQLVGAVHDVTAAQEVTERIASALESMAVGYLVMDASWRMVYANAEAERVTGHQRQDLLGRNFWATFPATVGTIFEHSYRGVVATGTPEVFEAYYPEPLHIWVEVRAVREGDGLALYFLDITARRKAQQAVEDAAARAHLLAAVIAGLTATLDAEVAAQRLAQLVVPALGDWCVIALVSDEAVASTPATARVARGGELRRTLRDVGSWHREEALRPLVEDYAACRLAELTDESIVWRALRQSTPLTVSNATQAVGAVLTPGGRAQELLTRLAPEAAAVFPLRAHGRSVGVLTLFSGVGRAPLSAQQLATATEVADRAGLALDAARLHRQQRDLAEGLQRSLLSEPPEPDHGQIIVRYAPAAEAAQVGGDWYDAFMQPEGATVLVIGDVVGHDTQAAAAMSQVRTLVRGFGAVGDEAPAQILAMADLAMANLQLSTTATAIVARLEQTLDERRRGVTRLRWSNAGHPPGMIISTDGTVLPLSGTHADLLLGVVPDVARLNHEVLLERGATVLLYTDGLVERRDQSLSAGLDRLQEVLKRLAADDTDLDTLVDRLLVEMLPVQQEDDVAVIAIRLHRQDRPRPAEAGPQRIPDHVPPEPDLNGRQS